MRPPDMRPAEESGGQPPSEIPPPGSVPARGPLPTLESERMNAATSEIDRMSPLEIVQAMNAEDATVATAVATELPQIARAIEAIAARLRRGGRMIYIGAGTSG